MMYLVDKNIYIFMSLVSIFYCFKISMVMNVLILLGAVKVDVVVLHVAACKKRHWY